MLPPAAWTAAEAHLRERLARVLAPSSDGAARTPEGDARARAVLTRVGESAAETWAASTAEFAARLSEDLAALEDAFGGGTSLGGVREVQFGLSDPHDGGRTVAILTFESGVRVVYKPRPLGLEAFYDSVLVWLAARGGPALRRLNLVRRPTHGWIEYVEPAPCADAAGVARFYERCGALLALAYAFNGTDFHHENLLASGEHPVLIDLEGLLKPHFDLEEQLPTQDLVPAASKRRFLRTPLNTRMLPLLKGAASGHAADTSALGFAGPPAPNAPHLGGQPVPVDGYVDDVVRGFTETYGVLLAHRDEVTGPGGLLDRAAGLPVRFILRHTSLYASLIARSLRPEHLESEAARFIQFDVLCRPFLALDERPAVWPAIAAERAALDRMDVPLFTVRSDSRALTLPSGEEVPGVFARSALDEARARFDALGEADLAEQTSLVRASFAVRATVDLSSLALGEGALVPVLPRSWMPPSAAGAASPNASMWPARALAEAEREADALARRAEGPEGAFAPLGLQYHAAARRAAIGPANVHVLAGYPGAALLFAALARVTGSEHRRAQALGALAPLRVRLPDYERVLRTRRNVDVGVGIGVGSVVYALARTASLLGDDDVARDAQRIVRRLDPTRLRWNGAPDALTGAAGAALGLLAVDDPSGDALGLACAWGRHLLGARVQVPSAPGVGWASKTGRVEAGLAYGLSGVALALARLGRASGVPSFTEAANEAFALEHHLLGPGLAEAGAVEGAAAWSHGLTGVGLARLDAPDADAAEAALGAALRGCAERLDEGADVLCCGRAGRIELLLDAGHILGRSVLAAMATAAAARVADERACRGAYRLPWGDGPHDTGAFTGSPGVAYVLLRTAYPDTLPALTRWA